jgi:ribosomal protein S18 acetylase RimI-like enzyme
MLGKKKLSDIKKLQHGCEQKENIKLKLNWDMLETRNEQELTDFFYYEDGKLVGFVGLYDFGSKVEICGMVHPNYRRKGIFTRLFDKAFYEIRKGRIKQVLLNAPSNSLSAKGFLQSIPCHFSFSEHQMKWSEIDLGDEEDIILRKSTHDDFETEIQLDISCFGFLEEDARKYNQRIRREETQDFYMIEADQERVGKIRIQHMNGETWIYGFAIFPQFQGKGIGRKALRKIIRKQHEMGYTIFLEVEAKNANALKLYEKSGFKAFDSQDYYQYNGE